MTKADRMEFEQRFNAIANWYTNELPKINAHLEYQDYLDI